MAMDNRPKGREKHVTGGGSSIYKRGEGLGTGPVGSGKRPSSGGNDGGGKRSGGGGLGIIGLILVALLGGGGSLLGGLGGSGSSGTPAPQQTIHVQPPQQSTQQPSSGGSSLSGAFNPYGSFFGGTNTFSGNSNSGKVDTTVASGSRDKRTVIKGDGSDQVTVMVFMCGADLESRSAMATKDLQEMAKAKLSDNVNLIVYTGGAKQWQNSAVSNRTNQIYQVKDGGLIRLEADMGNRAMVSPDTLTAFIKYCKKNFPANRNELIFWDHGGGSLTGYGYDELHASSGSMNLSGINQALKAADMTFDFIGFDACLMATAENALMLDKYADYLVASEETEPGYGWYYTDWLTTLSKNPGTSTLEIGKQIVDTFTQDNVSKGQNTTTLSVIDLAEFSNTVPEKLSAWSKETAQMIKNGEYKTVSNARASAKEFARSSAIDQIDFVNLCELMGTDSGKDLAEVLRGAVKYNRTSSSISNAYGVSVYFPYKKMGKVKTAVNTYDEIGMDDDYAACIRAFASIESAGQAASGGQSSPIGTLLGSSGQSGSGSYSSQSSSGSGSYGSLQGTLGQEIMMELLSQMLTGQSMGIAGLDRSNADFFDEDVLESAEAVSFLTENQLDGSDLVWTKDSNGQDVLVLSEKDWSNVQNLELNVYLDDGEGFIDLGLDNVFEFNENGDLCGSYDRTWVAIDEHPVAYYFSEMETDESGDDYRITGYVPAFLNGERVRIILEFTDENPEGSVLGAEKVYDGGETETMAKGLLEIVPGDVIDYICDYYTYSGDYQDSYYLGDSYTADEELSISNVDIGDAAVSATYRVTDIYNQHYWTEVMH